MEKAAITLVSQMVRPQQMLTLTFDLYFMILNFSESSLNSW